MGVLCCRLVSRRCHNISAMCRFVPGSSQNRTWSVTPSGSQSESSTKGWDSGLAIPHRLRAPSFRPGARSFRAAPRGRSEPHVRLAARLVCQTLQSRGHGQSPLSVGPCFPARHLQTATPLLRPHYRASPLLWVAPTSARLRPHPRFLHLFAGARSLRTDVRISSVTAYSHCQARHSLGPRGAPLATGLRAAGVVACRWVKTVGAHPLKFRGSIPSRSASPVTLAPRLLSRLRICRPVTSARSKARYWARG